MVLLYERKARRTFLRAYLKSVLYYKCYYQHTFFMLRIASLAPSNTEILYALGCDEEIVATTKLCDYPEKAQTKKRIGTWTQTDVEELAKIGPDIILTSYFLPEALHQYTGRGEIYHLHPRTLTDVYHAIKDIGDLVNKKQAAKTLVQNMQRAFARLASCASEHQQNPEIYSEEWAYPPMIAGNWLPEIISLCGGKTTRGIEPGKPSQKIMEQELFLWNPEMIVAHWCGRAQKSDVERIKNRPNWNHLQAVKNNHVYRIDDSLLNRPGPRLVEGAAQIHQAIHRFLEKTPFPKTILQEKIIAR